MFIDFRVSNYGCFRDEAWFSAVTSALRDDTANVVECREANCRLVTSAAVFGPNGSGKSMLFRAVRTLQHLVSGSQMPGGTIPYYNPFRGCAETKEAPIAMRIRFTAGGKVYDYSVSYDAEHIVSEELAYYATSRRSVVFSRDCQELTFGQSAMKGLSVLRSRLAPNRTFLALAAENGHELSSEAYRAIVCGIVVADGDYRSALVDAVRTVSTSPGIRDKVLKALKLADTGITGFEAELTESGEFYLDTLRHVTLPGTANVALSFAHMYPENTVPDREMTFPWTEESKGNLQLFCTLCLVIGALEEGKTLFIDEFGTFLHSEISQWVLKQFRFTVNPNNAQLFVNTQDQFLMNLDNLRRDQIWFTEKERLFGSARLYSLSHVKGIRKDIDAASVYWAGKFGAYPVVEYGKLM